MNFISFFIQRPVFAWVLNTSIVLIGLVCWNQITLRQYPAIESPTITVVTNFEGAGAEVVESQITRIIEKSLVGLEGLKSITSSSSSEQSNIFLSFHHSRPIDAAAADVRDRLSETSDSLPREIRPPSIQKADTKTESVLTLALSGEHFSSVELTDYVKRYLVADLESISGVSNVSFDGQVGHEMHIVLDPVSLASFGLTVHEVSKALRSQNFQRPAGRLVGNNKEFLVTTTAKLSTPEQFNALVLENRKGQAIRLSDVGKAILRSSENRSFVTYNGKPVVCLGLVAQSQANPIDISKNLAKKMPKISENLPKGMNLEVIYDRSVFVNKSLHNVYKAIAEAIVLVTAIIFIFLRSLRASLVPLITIPISLVGGCFVVYALGFTLNTLTLLSMVLAVGLVVDDAIVVLENIYRYIEEGVAPVQAAFKGTKEIQFSIIAMTITLAIVYTPIALVPDLVGKLFKEFSLTLAGTVLISGFVSLTLSPMMCARLLRAKKTSYVLHKKIAVVGEGIESIIGGIYRLYNKSLTVAFCYSKTVFLAGCLAALGGYVIGAYVLPSELEPAEDQGVIRTTIQSPSGSTLNYVTPYAKEVSAIFSSHPDVLGHLNIVNAGKRSAAITLLQPWHKRKKSCDNILPDINNKLKDITGLSVVAFCSKRSLLGSASSGNISFSVQGTSSWERLVQASQGALSVMKKHPGLENVDWDVPAPHEELVVHIDRSRASALGVDPVDIATTLDILIGGRRFTDFERENKLYPVRIFVEEENRRQEQDVFLLDVRGTRDNKPSIVSLTDLVEVKRRHTTPQINHHEGMRAIEISASVKNNFDLKSIYQEIKPAIRNILPTSFRITESGGLKKFLESNKTIAFIFFLALVFVFLVLAAQFESFLDPLIVILSVPLALTGAVFVLFLVPRGSINIYSQIGLVTLIGLITKHGILIVDFANRLQKEHGLSPQNAVQKACQLRFRPILMTTLAMALGALPLALSTDAGSEIRRQIGWTIVGGMLIGTFFTLFMTPLFYVFCAYLKKIPQSIRNIGAKNTL